MSIFVTGATGFLGSALLQRLVEQGNDIVALVRATNEDEGRRRLTVALQSVGGPAQRFRGCVRAVLGSLDQPGLGLATADRELVLAACSAFLHCGGSVRFDLPLAQARAVNVGGTKALLDLALARQRRSGPIRVDYVSTAYVAGNRTDLVLETELDAHKGHKNTYEQSKFEAEALVRQHQAELPITIHRPSIIVGDAASGHTTSFNTIYWPAKVYAWGLWRTCPGHPDTPIDLVPVDFVRDAILALQRDPRSLGRCFHLASGPEAAMRLAELGDILMQVFPGRKPVRFVDPRGYMRTIHPLLKYASFGTTRRIVQLGESYVPYFVRNPLFDTTNTRELLAQSGVAVPNPRRFVRRLFEYCLETDWGRKAASVAVPEN